MPAPASDSAAHDLPRALASARWAHLDGELVVASETANPGLREALAPQAERVHQSLHFAVFSSGGLITVLHRLEPAGIDNDLAELVAGELARPGNVAVSNAFERCFAGVVLSSASDAGEAWRTFYENTLSRLEQAPSSPHPGSGPVSVFGRIYDHARALVAGSSVLDVGTCFGFFPLLLRGLEPQLAVAALDVSEPMVELARDADAAGTIEFVRGDALSLPFADGSFDTVTALHLLEHLDFTVAGRALGEMGRVARRRVIAAVPLEEEPDPAYGHLQSFDREGLTALGEKTGWRCDFEDYLGGWLVLEPRE